MKIQWTALLAGVAAAGVLAAAATASYADDVSRNASDSGKMFDKLGRGIVNTLTGFVEVPKNMAREWRRTDPFTGCIVGFIKGVGWGWGRTWTGIYDVVTFPLPIPEGYVPLMEPEFVLTDIWGEPIPEFTEMPEWSPGTRGKQP
ncbi:MAG: exosortase system-associated protein, TIGR04073 family [Candidatus Sumerlaeota bacterium]|nr:exosortase system-associated protein, TIGR04073 family [Candidatus Sumerlaeota bacterium]